MPLDDYSIEKTMAEGMPDEQKPWYECFRLYGDFYIDGVLTDGVELQHLDADDLEDAKESLFKYMNENKGICYNGWVLHEWHNKEETEGGKDIVYSLTLDEDENVVVEE